LANQSLTSALITH